MNEKITKARQGADMLVEDIRDIFSIVCDNMALDIVMQDLILQAAKIAQTLKRLED